MEIAQKISEMSKCCKLKVGSVLTMDDRVIGTGYNGSPSGFDNCDEYFQTHPIEGHHEWSANFELHAEMSAILYAASAGIKTRGATLYCNYIPCHNCLKHIVQSGISRVVYKNEHPKVKYTDDTYNLIKVAKLEVQQIRHDGTLLNPVTGSVTFEFVQNLKFQE